MRSADVQKKRRNRAPPLTSTDQARLSGADLQPLDREGMSTGGSKEEQQHCPVNQQNFDVGRRQTDPFPLNRLARILRIVGREFLLSLTCIFGRDEKIEAIGVPDNSRLDALGTQDKGI